MRMLGTSLMKIGALAFGAKARTMDKPGGSEYATR